MKHQIVRLLEISQHCVVLLLMLLHYPEIKANKL